MSIDTKKLRQIAKTHLRGLLEPELTAIADHIDAQVAEIERLKKALRVAVLALEHATQEHGKAVEVCAIDVRPE